MTYAPHKEFERTICGISRRRHLWQVFSDFCECSALSLANALHRDDAREQRYLDIVGRYEHDEVQAFPVLFGITAMALEGIDCDFLGEVFQRLELASHWHGQYFTPYPLAQMMAALQLADADAAIAEQGFVTIQEPACGAGAMVIACARVLLDKQINYQQAMHVTAIDIDSTAAHMAYIQFSLLHIPAIVLIGNTLTLEMRESFRTPAHDMGLWDYKLARHGHETTEKPAEMGQIDLFQEAV